MRKLKTAPLRIRKRSLKNQTKLKTRTLESIQIRNDKVQPGDVSQ